MRNVRSLCVARFDGLFQAAPFYYGPQTGLQGAMQTALAEKGHTRQSFGCHDLLKHMRDTILFCALRPDGPLLPCLLEKRTLKLRQQGRTSARLARWFALRGKNTEAALSSPSPPNLLSWSLRPHPETTY